MAYDTGLAERINEYLSTIPNIDFKQKKMFRGVTFMVNDKMCVSVSGENLMCRFDPLLQDEIAQKKGFRAMIMKGKECKGYCYVSPEGISDAGEFEFWLSLCLSFNQKAISSKRKKPVRKSTKASIG